MKVLVAGGAGFIGSHLCARLLAEGHRVLFRFGVRNPEAEQWLREHSAQLVTRIVDDQRLAIRTAMTEGLARGDNPRVSALDIVGRVNRVTGRREGGVIGITAAQERYVASARAEVLSGDPEQLRHYLTRERRDKRFDAIVKRALARRMPVAAWSGSDCVFRPA